tara:strand:- start:2143 stop:2775 length:633 start_codon:yes stop_codon:yes gene_type:complete
MISFSAGALLGDVFIHLLPEVVKEKGFTLQISLWIIGGIGLFLVVEKIIHWRHCHIPTTKDHPHPFAIMNLFGDGVHNLLDGLIIGISYFISIPVGIATTVAVIFHEIPQEISDLGVLLHGGFSRFKALCINFLTALMAILGAAIALIIGNSAESLIPIIIPLAAGGFIYIAGADLIPELHKEVKIKRSLLQLISFALGVFVMILLLNLG